MYFWKSSQVYIYVYCIEAPHDDTEPYEMQISAHLITLLSVHLIWP